MASDHAARLVAILKRAVDLQPEADRIVRACSAPGDVPRSMLSDAQRVTSVYARLGEELEPLRSDPAVSGLAVPAQQCVDHHLLLVDGAANMALPPPPYHRRTDPRAAAEGLGEPGRRLRELLQDARRLAGE
ncbi:hypothetical protein [Actinoallomurus acaciae]|uniref:Uncharacterized protein n=1 Tax=Actinoallomurus acaciae TaxID=502577 RepID=A0ABV5Y933_9ACTN